MAGSALCDNSLKFILFSLCFVGFLAVIYKQWVLYTDKATSTSIKWDVRQKERFPYIVFCPSQGVPDVLLNQSEYDMQLNEGKGHFQVSLMSMKLHELDLDRFVQNETHEFYTLYFGKCKGFYFPNLEDVRSAVKFNAVFNDSIIMYLLPHPSDLPLLSFMASPIPPVTMDITRDTLFEVRLQDISMLDSDIRPCTDSRSNMVFGHCAANRIREEIKKLAAPCLPLPVHSIAPELEYKECNNATLKRMALSKALDVVANLYNPMSIQDRCPFPCLSRTFEIQAFNLQGIQATRRKDKVEDDSTYIILRLGSMFIKSESEFHIYNTVGIISATGGTLGMFLGWSCFQNTLPALGWLSQKLRKLSS